MVTMTTLYESTPGYTLCPKTPKDGFVFKSMAICAELCASWRKYQVLGTKLVGFPYCIFLQWPFQEGLHV